MNKNAFFDNILQNFVIGSGSQYTWTTGQTASTSGIEEFTTEERITNELKVTTKKESCKAWSVFWYTSVACLLNCLLYCVVIHK